MTTYKNILVAVALEGGAEEVLSRAAELIKQAKAVGTTPQIILLNACYLSLIHI